MPVFSRLTHSVEYLPAAGFLVGLPDGDDNLPAAGKAGHTLKCRLLVRLPDGVDYLPGAGEAGQLKCRVSACLPDSQMNYLQKLPGFSRLPDDRNQAQFYAVYKK